MANPSNEPDVKPAATFPAPNTFADVLHMQLAEELAAVHSAHQLWIQHLGYSVDESSSDEEKQEHRNKHLYLGLEKRRLEQLAHRRFGTTAYELMACGEHEYLVHGLHNERWRFTSDFQDAVRPTVNDYKSTKSVRAITAGSMHSVMLNVYGTPYSWGVAEDGALGRRVDDDSAMDGQPSRVSGFSSFEGINEDDTMCQIAAGETFTLYLSLRGNVYASGYARDIDRNKFSFSRNNELVVQVEMPGKVCFLEAGFNAGLAVLMDGSVVTFGPGNCGELSRNAEMAQPTDNGIFLIQPKTQYAFPKTDEEIANQTEQEKAEEKAAMEEFVHEHFMTPDFVKWSLPAKRQVSAAALGGYHLVVVARVEGSWQTMVYASGCNGEGQLGLGDVINRHALTRVPFFDDKNIAYLACGEDTSLALSIDGLNMYSFGRAENGALGIGPLAKDNRGPRKIPVEVTFPSSSPIVCITGGDHHYLAINKKHDVYSWGLIDDCRTGHVERPGPGGDSPVYSPTLLSLADHCGEETTRVHVHAACAGTAHSIFLVKRYGPNPKKRANDESAVADVSQPSAKKRRIN